MLLYSLPEDEILTIFLNRRVKKFEDESLITLMNLWVKKIQGLKNPTILRLIEDEILGEW
jgi:hypothetical protein